MISFIKCCNFLWFCIYFVYTLYIYCICNVSSKEAKAVPSGLIFGILKSVKTYILVDSTVILVLCGSKTNMMQFQPQINKMVIPVARCYVFSNSRTFQVFFFKQETTTIVQQSSVSLIKWCTKTNIAVEIVLDYSRQQLAKR